MLRGLGFDFTGGLDVRHVDQVHEDDVVTAQVMSQLAHGFHERQAFNVADGAADFTDDDIDALASESADVGFDFIGDVRNHLHGAAVVFAGALLLDHRLVDTPASDRRIFRARTAKETFVMAKVEIGFGTVIRDVDLTVLKRIHGAGIDIQIRVELLDAHRVAHRDQQAADRGAGDAFAQRTDHATGDDDVAGHVRSRARGHD